MTSNNQVLEKVIIKFAGDSGDGSGREDRPSRDDHGRAARHPDHETAEIGRAHV